MQTELIIAVALLVYSILSLDAQRRCDGKTEVPSLQKKILTILHVGGLVLSAGYLIREGYTKYGPGKKIEFDRY